MPKTPRAGMNKVTAPYPPQAFVSAPPSDTVFDQRVTVAAGDNLQAALQTAASWPAGNHLIELERGNFVGNFRLPPRPKGLGWITIRPRVADLSELPPAGRRVPLSWADTAPKLISPNQSEALRCFDDTHGWRIVALEITNAAALTQANDLVRFGWCEGGAYGNRDTQARVDAITSGIIFERNIVRPGNPACSQGRCLVANAKDQRYEDNIIGPAQSTSADAQAILSYSSPGPTRFFNNELFATGQCLFLSGAGKQPFEDQVIPQDIEMYQNWLRKLKSWNPRSPEWDGRNWSVKPGFESKGCKRFEAQGNVVENSFSWPAFHITSRYNLDMNIENNKIMNSVTAFNVWDTSTGATQDVTGDGPGIKRLRIINNLAVGILRAVNPNGSAYARGGGFGFFPLTPTKDYPVDSVIGKNGSEDWWCEHNTLLPTDYGLGAITSNGGQRVNRWRVANNISGYAFLREGPWDMTVAIQNASVVVAGEFDLKQNAMLRTFTGTPSPKYDQATWSEAQRPGFIIAGFPADAGVDVTTGALAATSPLKGQAVTFDNQASGQDLGVDFAAVDALTSGVIEGTPAKPRPPDTQAPPVPASPVPSAITVSGFTLTTPAVSDPQGAAVSYEWDIVPDGGSARQLASSEPSVGVTELQANTAHVCRVRALDVIPNRSAWSAPTAVWTSSLTPPDVTYTSSGDLTVVVTPEGDIRSATFAPAVGYGPQDLDHLYD